MCRLLTRFFDCEVDGDKVEHSYQYLERCANPEYSSCIAEGALCHVSEWYERSCHQCTGSFIHPMTRPARTQMSKTDEQSPAAQKAAISYFKSLSDVLETSMNGMVLRSNPDQTALAPEQACDCAEANSAPELHNISAAIRQVVARANTFSEDGDVRVKREFKKADWQAVRASMFGGYHITRESLAAQPNLSELDYLRKPSAVDTTRVLPFAFETWDHRTRYDHLKRHYTTCINTRYDSRGCWKMEASINAGELLNTFHADVEKSWQHRHRLMKVIMRLLSVDNGLTLVRCYSIIDLAMGLLGQYATDIKARDDLAEALYDLLHSSKTLMVLLDTAVLDTIAVGEIYLVPERFMAMTHLLRRNREMAHEGRDENLQVIWDTRTHTRLTAEEMEKLRSQVKLGVCPICDEDVKPPGDGHQAVRLRCPGKHVPGMSCWTRMMSSRRLKLTEEGGIPCHVCGMRVGIGTIRWAGLRSPGSNWYKPPSSRYGIIRNTPVELSMIV
ncbi:hypothetical protein CMUS01_04962 [Colletotrichum musicola]|uniref:Uncharacterized protein n=1 Tax=Colletotrichum musicola TaxID=2175873 RepID=A0A8H6KTV2_9PEZI|nr:hypothetical protein CMUS01_04962 [Colletotrichum musicola]